MKRELLLIFVKFTSNFIQSFAASNAEHSAGNNTEIAQSSTHFKDSGPCFYTIGHIFYAEEMKNYHIAFKYYRDMKPPFFRSTLIDNLDILPRQDWASLKTAITTRCASWDSNRSHYLPINDPTYSSATMENSKTHPDSIWDGYQYPAIGHEDPMIHYIAFEKRRQPTMRVQEQLKIVPPREPSPPLQLKHSAIQKWVGDVEASNKGTQQYLRNREAQAVKKTSR